MEVLTHPCHCDICLEDRYCSPCAGCPDGHPSFWKTIVESAEWKAWRQQNPPQWDFDECEVLGAFSPAHFAAFLAWIKAGPSAESHQKIPR